MGTVFISYSRSDREFADIVNRRLKEANRETWIDMEDIPPSATWREEIQRAIENVDVFIFIMSPHSLASEVCQSELNHAVDNKKRIVPILYREVARSMVPASLGEPEWISFLPDVDFEAAFSKLLLAIDLNIDYWHESAQLLGRARAWQSKPQNRSLLLHGSELQDAERWIVDSANQRPGPTQLHLKYITASRRNATAQQRRRVGFLTAVSAALGVLTILSFLLFSLAQNREAEAIHERDVAVTRQAELLAAQVNTALSSNQPDLAALLSVKSLQVRNNYDTRSSLLQALENSPHLQRVLKGHRFLHGAFANGVADLAFTSDGSMLVSGGAGDGRVLTWNTVTGSSRVMTLPRYAHHYGIFSIALSPDGHLLATAGFDGVYLWNFQTGEFITSLYQATSTLDFNLNPLWEFSSLLVAFSPDNKTLAVSRCVRQPCVAGTGELALLDVRSKVRISVTEHLNPITALAFSHDGTTLATSGCSQYASDSIGSCMEGSIQFWAASTGKALGQPISGHSGAVLSVDFAPDGKTLASGGSDNAIILWDTAKRSSIGKPLIGHAGPVTKVRFSPDGNMLASASADKLIILWSTQRQSQIDSPLVGHNGRIISLSFSPDGTMLASGDDESTILLWRANFDSPMSFHVTQEGTDGIESMTFSHDGRYLASGGTNGIVQVWDMTAKQIVRELATFKDTCVIVTETATERDTDLSPCFVDGVAFTPDGTSLFAETSDGKVMEWDTQTWTPRGDPLRPGRVRCLAISPDGSTIAAAGQSGIWLWNVSTRQLRTHLQTGSEVYSIAFTSDSTMLAAGDVGGRISVWKIPAGTLAMSAAVPGDYISQVGFKGSTLVSYSTDGKVRFWDAKLGKEQRQLAVASPGSYGGFAFTPDGTQMITGTWDREVTIWDVASGKSLFAPFQPHDQVELVAVAPDGKTFVSADYLQGVITFWTYNLDTWRNSACALAHRNLTSEEVRRLSPDDSQICKNLPLDNSVIRDKVLEARAAMQARDNAKAASLYRQATQWVVQTDDSNFNNNVCGEGSVYQLARVVLPACERAVALSPDDGAARDGRGLARALTGDFSGAIADFQYFVDWANRYGLFTDVVDARVSWISALRGGHNPFTPDLLKELEPEYVADIPDNVQ